MRLLSPIGPIVWTRQTAPTSQIRRTPAQDSWLMNEPRDVASARASAPLHRRRYVIAFAAPIVAVGGVALAAGWVTISAGTTVGELLVAGGTLALAWFTYDLGRAARAEGDAVGSQVELERERREQEAQPWVVPAPGPSWTWKSGEGQYTTDAWRKLLPVKNVGPGAALNGAGALNWGSPSGVRAEMLPTSIGPGDREDLRVSWASAPQEDWRRVEGTLEYDDVIRRRWQTRFVIEERESVRCVQVEQVVDISKPWRAVAGPDATATRR